MPLHLLTGSPASGKTHEIARRLKDTQTAGAAPILIAPAQHHAQLRARLDTAGADPETPLLDLDGWTHQLAGEETREALTPALHLAHASLAASGLGLDTTPASAEPYAQAIDRLRYAGIEPGDLPDAGTPPRTQLQDAYRRYREQVEPRYADRHDLRHAAQAALAADDAPLPPLFVDGYLDLHPAEQALLAGYARRAETTLASEEIPSGLTPDRHEALPPRTAPAPQRYRPDNPVREIDWILDDVTHHLAHGLPPREALLIGPDDALAEVEALARLRELPVQRARPRPVTETAAGRLLARLLRLPSDTGPDTLYAVPELAPLARAMDGRRVHGPAAAAALAPGLAQDATLHAWLERLTPPSGEAERATWRSELLASLERLDPSLADAPHTAATRRALYASAQAAHVAPPHADPAAWWLALLARTPVATHDPHALTLATPREAEGLRVERAYLLRATSDAQREGERDDPFFAPRHHAPSGPLPAWPHRSQRRRRAHLLARGATTIVTSPAAGEGGPYTPDAILAPEGSLASLPDSEKSAPQPPVPTVGRNGPPTPVQVEVSRDPVRVRTLEHTHTCGFRAHFTHHARDDGAREREPWLALLGELAGGGASRGARRDGLARDYPMFAPWLDAHAATLARFVPATRLPAPHDGVNAYVKPHGVTFVLPRNGSPLPTRLYATWLLAPGTHYDEETLEKRRNETLEWRVAEGALAQIAPFALASTLAWPVGGKPIPLTPAGRDLNPKELQTMEQRYRSGDATPVPGWHCRNCRLADLCRATG